MKQRNLTPEEKRLWRHFTQDVERANALSELEEVKISSEPLFAANLPHDGAVKNHPKHSPSRVSELQADDLSQIQFSQGRRHRRGQYQIEATIDLHGLNQSDAMFQFGQFLHHCVQQGKRTVRVITGYGKMSGGTGILRKSLPRWVNFPENRHLILAYHQARPEEGGRGAWIFLLRRSERLS